MPRNKTKPIARKGTGAGATPIQRPGKPRRMAAAGVLAKAKTRPKGGNPRGNGGGSGYQPAVVAAPAIRSQVARMDAVGKNKTRSLVVSRIFDVTPNGTGTLTVALPTAATDSVGTHCCHLGAGLSYRHATLAAAFQRVRVSSIAFEYEAMCGSTTTGSICMAIISEYDHASGAGALPTDYDTLCRRSNSKVIRPWSTGPATILRWQKLEARDGELQPAARGAYTRADAVQYLFMMRGSGLPTAAVAIGKVIVHITLEYISPE